MTQFSKVMNIIINRSGMSARPGHYADRGVTLSDLNVMRLQRLHAGIAASFGEKAAENFVNLVASVKELSASNFLDALSVFEAEGYEWDPAKHASQVPFCEESPKRRDQTIDDPREGMALVIDAIADEPALPQSSRFAVAGGFVRQYGTPEQANAMKDQMMGRARSAFGGFWPPHVA